MLAPTALQLQSHLLKHIPRLNRSAVCTQDFTNRSRLMASQQPSSSSSISQLEQDNGHETDPIVQWVVLRRDLWTDMGWPLGPVIAQACHASSAAMILHIDEPLTQEYTAAENMDHMHKVGSPCYILTNICNNTYSCLLPPNIVQKEPPALMLAHSQWSSTQL